MPKLAIAYNQSELNALQYPVMVEGWDKKNSGKIKRTYIKEFTGAERNQLNKWYIIFYRWYLVSGTPDEHIFKPKSLLLIQRACNFFGNI